MQKVKCILFSFLLSSSLFLKAQNDKEAIIGEIVQDLLENSEEEQDFTTLIEELHFLYEHPININQATREELERLPMFSESAITNVLKYRAKLGQFYSLYELQAISGISYTTASSLQHFLRIGAQKKAKVSLRKMLKYSRNELLLKGQRSLSNRLGFKKFSQTDFKTTSDYNTWKQRRYLGSPWNLSVRYNSYYTGKYHLGLFAEKDAGEEFFKGTQKRGFDHYAAFIALSGIGFLKKLILGDYLVCFGQGLAVWNAYSLGKSSSFVNLNKRNEGLRKFASANENKYLQGIGTTVQLTPKLEFSAYCSSKKIDASTKGESFSSFLNTGYHRSHNEIEKRKTVQEQIIGTNITFNYHNLKLGANAIVYRFSKALEKKNALADLYHIQGKKGANYSLSGNYRYNSIYAFGEWALDYNRNNAFLIGSEISANERLQFTLLYRDYAPAYSALYASAFGDKTRTSNERAWYLGVEVLPLAKWQLSAYFDMYEFPWLQQGVTAPAHGQDYKIRLSYQHSQKINAYLQYYYEENEKNTQQNIPIRFLVKEKRTKLRFQSTYQLNEHLRFKNRIALSWYQKEGTFYRGFLVYQDISYKAAKIPLSLTARYAVFDIDNYNARLYAYENDVLYAFSNAMFLNRGVRFYLNAKWDISQHFTLWAKYSFTQYRNKKEISTGLDKIESSKLNEVKLQLRYQF